jgi:hypothetical protein
MEEGITDWQEYSSERERSQSESERERERAREREHALFEVVVVLVERIFKANVMGAPIRIAEACPLETKH